MAASIRECLIQGPMTSKQIQDATGLSQTAVSRQIRSLGDSIIRLPSGRSPRYALTRNAFGADDKLPLFMVDAHGNNASVATIRPLAHGGFFVQPDTGMPTVLLGDGGNGLYDGLPYFLEDLRPQGFLGRQIASEMHAQSEDFSSDPDTWSTDLLGRYLISNGDDLPGNFKFGQQAHYRIRRKPTISTPDDYPQMADSVMSGIIPDSSAGGERPKFTAFCGERMAHVIVKFSPKGDNEIARRWRDILITEFHATEAIHSVGFPAAETRLIERDGRLFLESLRFDRSGEYGRMPMISLLAVDAEFVGLGSHWLRVMNDLYTRDLVSYQHVYDTEFLWNFGRLINNTDMHLGNLSLGIDGGVFRLLPAYDMGSMGFAPRGAEVAPYAFAPPDINGIYMSESEIGVLKSVVADFWVRVARDDRISPEFRAFLASGTPAGSKISTQALLL